MDPVRSLCYIGSQMGHFMVYCTGWVLDRAPCTKETMLDFFFFKLWMSVNGTQRCGIELHDIHRYFTGCWVINRPPDFGASQLGIRA